MFRGAFYMAPLELTRSSIKLMASSRKSASLQRFDFGAAAAAFLLSPDSAHIAFHDLYIDGGETLWICIKADL